MTLIDNIITNDTSNILLPGIIRPGVSDHYNVFSLILRYPKFPKSNATILFRRDKRNFETEFFRSQLEANLKTLLLFLKTPR